MPVTIVPLGISAATPTRSRHLSGTVLVREGEVLLFDCGEGTQYQMLAANLKRSHLSALFITHLHGDHCYGLFGLLTTLTMMRRRAPLTLIGPEGLRQAVETVFRLSSARFRFELRFVEVRPGCGHTVVLDMPEYRVEARPLLHRVFTVGYRFQEKDRPGHLDPEKARALGVTNVADFRVLKAGQSVVGSGGRVVRSEDVIGPPRSGVSFAYCFDTRPVENGVALARGADLLYHDATFREDLRGRAIQTGHSTAREAASIAARAGAKRLLLGHFSSRYVDLQPLVEEACTLFPETTAAQELRSYPVE